MKEREMVSLGKHRISGIVGLTGSVSGPIEGQTDGLFITDDMVENPTLKKMENLFALNVQIATVLPDKADWNEYRPFGISCLGLQKIGHDPILFYEMDRDGFYARKMSFNYLITQVYPFLKGLVGLGAKFVTWNGLGFDFSVLSEEMKAKDFLVEIALDHYDLQYQVIKSVGYPISRQRAAQGFGIETKPYVGKHMPRFWIEGKQETVLEYLKQNLRVTLEIAMCMDQSKQIILREKKEDYVRDLILKRIAQVWELRGITTPDRVNIPEKFSDSKIMYWMEKTSG